MVIHHRHPFIVGEEIILFIKEGDTNDGGTALTKLFGTARIDQIPYLNS